MNIIEMAGEVDAVTKVLLDRKEPQGMSHDVFLWFLERFAALVEAAARADEREAIAQMFEDAPALAQFAQNDHGNCWVCGFKPKLVIEAIRARGTT